MLTVWWPPADRARAAHSITLYRPSESAADRVFALAPDAAGRQRVSLVGVPAGRWGLERKCSGRRAAATTTPSATW